MFLNVCVLSGCNYLESINGISLRTSYLIIKESKDINKAFENLNSFRKILVTADYKEKFSKAYLTFQHQVVYCPIKKTLLHLNKIDGIKQKYKNLEFLGK